MSSKCKGHLNVKVKYLFVTEQDMPKGVLFLIMKFVPGWIKIVLFKALNK